MEKLIQKIIKRSDSKFINLYELQYNLGDKEPYKYMVASRRKEQDLECNTHKIDAVRIVPYFNKDNQTYVVLIKEFRYAINDYLYGTPAGLVDENENSKSSATRELKEEIGASVIKLEKMQEASCSSAGLTDEMIECYSAEIKLDQSQSLDKHEEIGIKIIKLDNLIKFVNSHKFDLQSALLLKSFYDQTKYAQSLGFNL